VAHGPIRHERVAGVRALGDRRGDGASADSSTTPIVAARTPLPVPVTRSGYATTGGFGERRPAGPRMGTRWRYRNRPGRPCGLVSTYQPRNASPSPPNTASPPPIVTTRSARLSSGAPPEPPRSPRPALGGGIGFGSRGRCRTRRGLPCGPKALRGHPGRLANRSSHVPIRPARADREKVDSGRSRLWSRRFRAGIVAAYGWGDCRASSRPADAGG
jgi:hypothetical protein